MLRWRLLLGLLLIAVLGGICWLDFQARTPGIWLGPLSLLVTLLASTELLWMMRLAGIEARPAIVYAGNFSIVACCWPLAWQPAGWAADVGWPAMVFVGWLLIALVVEIFAYRKPGGITVRLAATMFVLAYVGLLDGFLVLLRRLGDNGVGLVALLSVILVVKLCDIGAYTTGRLLGRHKMAPYLSPGKTIEGAVGGIVFAVAGAWLSLAWLLPRVVDAPVRIEPWQWISYGVIVGVAGMLGDLAESLLKRDFGPQGFERLAARLRRRARHRRLDAVCGAGRLCLLAGAGRPTLARFRGLQKFFARHGRLPRERSYCVTETDASSCTPACRSAAQGCANRVYLRLIPLLSSARSSAPPIDVRIHHTGLRLASASGAIWNARPASTPDSAIAERWHFQPRRSDLH
ncbi:MAG TPA: phosphatidate cytidylyltransferase [Pirellulales bacterium]|nr:phosphatidate cytidylyltransferase [Pirellulales bacterium]